MTVRFSSRTWQHGRKERMGQISLGAFILLLICNVSVQAAAKMQTFHLHPTSELVAQEESPSNLRRLAMTWLQSSSNAVYATLPKETDSSDASIDLQDFHAHRHLSRYERQYRARENLPTTFDGIYRDSNYTSERHLLAHKDTYQATPLNQGYGTHYVNLWVGTPTPQRKTVIVDTGSHYTAFPCTGCSRCGEVHHTDPYFNPDASASFRSLECNECIRGATCQEGKCSFSQSYTEGSSWDAYLAEDRVFCGGNDILDAADPVNQEFAIPFMFGCQTTESGLFVTQLADGIMGFSAHESTLPKKLYDYGKIDHNMFTMCFARKLGTSRRGVTAGVMTMGGVDERLHTSPMVYAKNMATMGWYTVFVRNVYIQNSYDTLEHHERITRIPIDISAVNSGKGVIVDSGTTDTYLHKKLAKSFGKIWKQVTGKEYHHRPISLTEEQLNQLPTVIIQCAGAFLLPDEKPMNNTESLAWTLDPSAPNDVLISIPPSSYMEYSPVAKLYTSRIYFTESQGGVLGANAMIGHNVLFDWEHGRVGFAKSTCEYPDEMAESTAVSTVEAQSRNCALTEQTLTRTCAESLDIGQCENRPNRILRGIETWSMVVTNQGTQDGMSCERAATIMAADRGGSKGRIVCNGGTCTEERPCQLKCADIYESSQSKAVAVLKSASKKCDISWSACDSSCTQTRVISELWTDGVCHEKARQKRSCHTGACIKSHPCHVPFVIRMEMGFQGRKSWSLKLKESIAKALVLAIGNETSESRNSLTAGDVNIVSTSSWGEGIIPGMKANIEISIVNQEAAPGLDSIGQDASRLAALAQGFRRSVQREKPPECNAFELYPLAKYALNVKQIIKSSPLLIDEVKKALGVGSAEIISVVVSSLVKKDDEVIPLGSFSAGFHTHRLRQYAHHNPFMAVLFFLSVSFLVFGTCSAFEWAIAAAMKKASLWFQNRAKENMQLDADNSNHSENENGSLTDRLVSTGSTTPEDNASLSSDRDHDDMLERLFHCATGTPPRKVKEDADIPLRISPFEQTHSLDESMDRSVSRGASPRKRKVDRHEVDTDLELARQKLERHV